MISEKRYQYVLDRACCQFEPDDPDFIRTTHRVYNAVDQCGDYEHLRSTRHFGPLAFYLAWHSSIDGLLVDMLDRDKAQDARDVVVLFADVHPNSSCAAAISELPQQDDDVAVIKTYLSTDCKNKDKVELSLRAMVDSQRSKGKTQNSSL
ncbi:28S ribosomal protein S22, mitochondrial [Aplysia californica]|uniref:28S ribosomal protein S22, mitochondrial n=1 Tax=Aplysia californica TaxID=6500 RepID=A0ABM1W313_APLCA|nr:28S ribosomal protein S22, mitochondrial [Aplysia californica]